jgi:hypothetical protein
VCVVSQIHVLFPGVVWTTGLDLDTMILKTLCGLWMFFILSGKSGILDWDWIWN